MRQCHLFGNAWLWPRPGLRPTLSNSFTQIDRILRVDHAGELGADRIYAGQLAVLGKTDVGPLIQVCRACVYTRLIRLHCIPLTSLGGRKRCMGQVRTVIFPSFSKPTYLNTSSLEGTSEYELEPSLRQSNERHPFTWQNMWEEEKRHLAKFEELIPKYRARPTALYPIWTVTGWAVGMENVR